MNLLGVYLSEVTMGESGGGREGKEEGKALGSGEVGQQRIMASVYGRGSSGESFWSSAKGP